MEQEKSGATKQSQWKSYLWLAMAAMFLLFSNGKWVIPLAAWLFPLLMMRFLRTQGSVRGLTLGAITYVAVGFIMYSGGRFLLPGISYFLMITMYSLLLFLPFVVDRLVTPRMKGFLATLLFPSAWTTAEVILFARGTWGAWAYTQYGNLPLTQIVSITGIWGLSFIMAWFASVINWSWEQKFVWLKIRHGIGLYFGILAAVLLFGGARLTLFPPESNRIRVASITTRRDLGAPDHDIFFKFHHRQARGDSLLTLDMEVHDDFFERTIEAARLGAKIILWPEYAVPVSKQNESALIERGRQLASQEKIFLMMALYSVPLDFPDQPWENKLVIIGPSGEVIYRYLKCNSAPTEPIVLGDGKIPIVDTPYGKITTAICADMYHLHLIRQAGRAEADLMFSPAKDWRGIAPHSTYMATFRAIENGFSMVRCTGDGLSIAVDYQGRPVAAADYFTSDEQIMIADLPAKGTPTIYAQIGDLFPWCCVISLVVLLLWTVVVGRRNLAEKY